jgi:hypothetical protein
MISRRRLSIATSVGIVVSALAVLARQQPPGIAAHNDPPPVELEDPIEAILATGGQRVTIGGKVLDFWWVKSLPLLPGTGDVSWAAVEDGTLVGALKLSAPYPDVRGKTIPSGLYTLRYGVAPQNNDQLRGSPSRDFLLLSPAAVDSKVAALGHDGVVALAKQTPGMLSLDPFVATATPAAPVAALDPARLAAPRAALRNEAGQTAALFSVPVSREGSDAGVLTFGLMLAGVIQP